MEAAMRPPAERRRLRHSAIGPARVGKAAKNCPTNAVGWVLLHADGGHPGDNPDFAAIRRWTAPADGVLTIDGALSHGSPNGDGVRARIVVSSLGIAGEWSAHNGQAPTDVEKINVTAGDTVDFITDCREHVTSDSFTWRVELSLKQGDGVAATFRSHEGFHGPSGQQADVEIESISGLAIGLLATADARRTASGVRVRLASSATTCAFIQSPSPRGDRRRRRRWPIFATRC